MFTKQLREMERQASVVITKTDKEFELLQKKANKFIYKNGNPKYALFNYGGHYEIHNLNKNGDWDLISGTRNIKEFKKWLKLENII